MENKKTLKKTAPAKLNLTLEVLEKESNGFHQIRSVMMKLNNLSDELVFEFRDEEGIEMTSSVEGLPSDENNLCFQAIKVFLQETGKSTGVKININKNIPLSAGLGGGSSNAAAAFEALNEYFGKPFDFQSLVELSSTVGKDIPFFLDKSKFCFVEARGEKIKPLKGIGKFPFSVLIIKPEFAISTGWAYEEVSRKLEFIKNPDLIKRSNISLQMKEVLENNPQKTDKYLYNDFEPPVFERFPKIIELKQALLAFGASASLMSGSGSTVFGLFSNKKSAFEAKSALEKYYQESFIDIG